MSPVTLPGLVAGAALGAAAVLTMWFLSSRRRRRRRGQFIHDLRTPLSSVKAYAEILEDEVTVEERRRFASIISEEADRMERMIRGRKRRPGPGPTGALPRSRPADPTDPGKTILVVDDDRFIVEATRRLLKREGYRTLGALGGEEALVRARGGLPDLILMDLTMPQMSGEEAVERLRADPATRDIPIIVTTGHDDDRAPGGAAGVMSKPFSRESLLEAMNRVMVESGR